MVSTVRIVAEFRRDDESGGVRSGGDCSLYADVTTYYGVVTRHHLSVDGGFFAVFVPAGSASEYRMEGGSDLLKIGAGTHYNGTIDALCMEPRQVYESLGEEVSGRVAASVLVESYWTAEWFGVWGRVFGLLGVQRAVSLAVADSRLVSHLSPEAAAAYAEDHRELVESGYLF